MVQFNTRANEILLKLVYYGPGLSGKTTNLQILHAMCQSEQRGELFSVNTQEDRTLFFDLLPIKLGTIYGNSIHLQVYTVPGQVQYDASRRVVLGGADGVVFVADSSEAKMHENVDSLSNLYHNLNANRLNIKQIPFVLQYNKRDLEDATPVGVMNRRLNFRSVPFFESIAPKGVGVLETFLAITKETVGTTFMKYHLDKKVKDFDELLRMVESNIRQSLREIPPDLAQPTQSAGTVLRHTNVSVNDLPPDQVASPQDLLEDALKSNMETAQLYSELKQVKDELERRNQQLADLAAQHERVAQENLKTRRYLEGLLQSVGEAIISFGPDGRVLTWNAAAEQMFGYARADIVGQPFQQLVPASQEGELERVMDQVSAGQALRNLSTERLRKDGEAFPVSITYAPIMGADDRVLAFSALVRDMSPLRNLEQKVKRAEVGSAFAGLLSSLLNELNNRLHSLAMRKDVTRKTPDETHLDALFHSLESALELLRPLQMALAPPPLQRHPAALNALVEEALAEVAGEAAASGVHIDTNLDPAIPETLLDPERVQASVVALLRSGLKRAALSSAKKLRVGTRRAESGLQLACQDSGQAWTEAERTRLFDLASASDAEALVLNLAAQMARAHGGRISARSQEGVGNAFLLELPMSEEVHSATPASLEGRKILVLDDEPFLLECLTDAFQSWGCEATPCAQATDAIDKLQQGSFDLVVSDIRMPGLSGIQFFDWVKANQPAMVDKLLYTTGDSFDPETRAFLDNAKLPHLSKPFDLKKLKQTALGLLK